MSANRTNKTSYIRHEYSGPRKSKRAVRAALKRFHTLQSRSKVWRSEETKKLVKEKIDIHNSIVIQNTQLRTYARVTGVDSVKADEAPNRGACTSSAPGNPVANATGSSAGVGLAMAKTAAETQAQSQLKLRTTALHGTSTGPSTHAKASAPATTHTTAGASLPVHPPSPPVAPQATFQNAAVTGQTVHAEKVFVSAWPVTRKGKGKNTASQAQCSKADHSGQPAPMSQGKRPMRKERRHECRDGGRLEPPSKKQVDATGKLSFSVGKRSAEVGTSRPTPDQSLTVAGGTTQKPSTMQQAAWIGQAMAKRALNETISPRGEHKRLRLDQSKRDATKSYAQAANASLSVAITCDRTGIISQGVSNQVLAAIQKQIISEACSPMQDTPGPTFNGKPLYAGGVLKLWCGNDHTLAWLKKTVSGLALPASTSLVVRSQSEIQKRVRCGIAIPDDQGVYEDTRNIGRALCYQNPWVDVKRWVLLHADKQQACWFVVLGVPEDQIPTLMNAERRLSIGLGSVYIKFQGQNGRFVDVPRNWDQAMNQMVEAGETIPHKNNLEATAANPAAAVESAAPSGLRLEGDEEGPACDGVPFVDL